MGALRKFAFLALFGALALPAFAQQAADTVAPESPSAVAEKQAVHAARQMVVAANPIATQAGLDVLRLSRDQTQFDVALLEWVAERRLRRR